MGVNNLPKVVTRQLGGRGSNSRPLGHQPNALATRLSIYNQSDKPTPKFSQVLHFEDLRVTSRE